MWLLHLIRRLWGYLMKLVYYRLIISKLPENFKYVQNKLSFITVLFIYRYLHEMFLCMYTFEAGFPPTDQLRGTTQPGCNQSSHQSINQLINQSIKHPTIHPINK